MNEWRELKTLQEVAEAQKNGEEIERNYGGGWKPWAGKAWDSGSCYHSRPRKKTKTIVLREALMRNSIGGYWIDLRTTDAEAGTFFIRWLDTPPREIEVPDAD